MENKLAVRFTIVFVGSGLVDISNEVADKTSSYYFDNVENFFDFIDSRKVNLEDLVTFIYSEDKEAAELIWEKIHDFFPYFFVVTPTVLVAGDGLTRDKLPDIVESFDYFVPLDTVKGTGKKDALKILNIAEFVHKKKKRELERKKYELLNHAMVLDLYQELKKEESEKGPLFYYGVDHNGILKTVDDKILKILGFSRDEIIGKHFSELIATEELNKLSRAFRERRTGDRGSKGIIIKFKKKGGGYKEFVVDTQGVHIPTVWEYPDKEPHRMYIGTFGRVNELKRKSKSRIDVFNTTREPVFIYSKKEKQLIINRGAELFLGYSPEEVFDKDPSFFEVEDYSYFNQAIEKLNEGETHIVYTTVVRRKEGQTVDCEVSIDRVEFDGDVYYIGLYRDITEYIKFIDKADSLIQLTWLMINSRSRKELLAKAASHIINILDIKYLIVSLWDESKKDFDMVYIQNHEKGEFLCDTGLEKIKKCKEFMEEMLEVDTTRYLDIDDKIVNIFRNRLGKNISNIKNFISVPLKVGDARLGVLGIFVLENESFTLRDIRMIELSSNVLSSGIYRYNLENKLIQNLENLERMVQERTRELEEFVYIVSHDLKTPLYAAKSFNDIIAEQFRKFIRSEEDEYIIRRIGENIDSAIKMINDLLTLSRVGTRELNYEKIDLQEIIHDYLIQYNAIKKSDVNLDITFHGDIQHIYGDRGRIVQLFTNLFGNSIKYRDSNDIKIDVRTSRKNGIVKIEVEDNGIGIDKKEIDKIFKVFYRGNVARDKNLEGSGCGLSIVKKIVEIHGGSISVESEPGRGTKFIIELPLKT